MPLDFETTLFVIAGFFILVAIFFIMLRSSNTRIAKKLTNDDTRQEKVEERLAKLSASVTQNTKDLDQIKKMLSERKENKIGPYDESIAKSAGRTSKNAQEESIKARE